MKPGGSVQLCSIELFEPITNLQLFSTMQLMELKLLNREICVAQILMSDKMYSGVVGEDDLVSWNETLYDDCILSDEVQ